jgi:hypothetical protein
MAKALALLDVVPGWLWALLLAVATAHGVLAELGEARAVAEASQARQQLTGAQLQAVKDLAAARGRAEAREATLRGRYQETIDALTTSRAADAGRIAGLAGRLQQYARPVACHPRGAATGAGAGAAGGGDGGAGAGLPGLAGDDLVIVDGQARLELAEFAVSARATGETLIKCRGLLRAAWQATN